MFLLLPGGTKSSFTFCFKPRPRSQRRNCPVDAKKVKRISLPHFKKERLRWLTNRKLLSTFINSHVKRCFILLIAADWVWSRMVGFGLPIYVILFCSFEKWKGNEVGKEKGTLSDLTRTKLPTKKEEEEERSWSLIEKCLIPRLRLPKADRPTLS